jgi:hypothetical protein
MPPAAFFSQKKNASSRVNGHKSASSLSMAQEYHCRKIVGADQCVASISLDKSWVISKLSASPRNARARNTTRPEQQIRV